APGGTTAGYPQYTFNGSTNVSFPVAVGSGSGVAVNGIFAPGPANGDAVTSSVQDAFTADSSPLCSPLPGAVTLSGAGTVAVASFSPGSLNFPDVPCGTTASPKIITFSNAGNVSYDINSISLDTGTSFSAYIGAPGTTSGTVPAMANSTPGTL